MARKKTATLTERAEAEGAPLPRLPELTSADFAGRPRSVWLLYLCGREAMAIADGLTEEQALVFGPLIEEAQSIGKALIEGTVPEDAACARLEQIQKQLQHR